MVLYLLAVKGPCPFQHIYPVLAGERRKNMVAADFTAIATQVTTVLGYASAAGVTLLGLILGTKAGIRFFRVFAR